MNDNEDGTGSPTSSSFLIPIPILTSNNTRRDFNIPNPKIFYIKISLTIHLLISHLILILHIIMNTELYFKHIIVSSGNPDDVEKEINSFAKDKYSEIVNITVTPECIGYHKFDNYKLSKYCYHLCIVYKEKEQ